MSGNVDFSSYLDTDNASPYAYYDAVNAAGGLVYDERMRAWLVSSADLIRDVMLDYQTYAHPYASMEAGQTYRELRANNPRSFQFLEGEEHRAMHTWWIRDLLSAKWVRQYRDSVIVPAVQQRIAALQGRESFDLADDYGEKIPITVFAALMGLPWQDEAFLTRVKSLNDRIAVFASRANSLAMENGVSAEDRAISDSAIAAGEELNELLMPIIRERQSGEHDDFVSRLWQGGRQLYADWNEIDMLDSSRRLLFAGSDTTSHAIANGFYLLLRDDALRAKVQAGDEAVLEAFREEVLRLHGSVHFRIRRAATDVQLGGQQIRAGQMVVTLLVASNMDASRYECPHQVQLDRKTPRAHLSFSYGPRVCPGSNLARAELSIALEMGLQAFPQMALLEGAPPPQFTGFLLRSWRPLHVRTAALPVTV